MARNIELTKIVLWFLVMIFCTSQTKALWMTTVTSIFLAPVVSSVCSGDMPGAGTFFAFSLSPPPGVWQARLWSSPGLGLGIGDTGKNKGFPFPLRVQWLIWGIMLKLDETKGSMWSCAKLCVSGIRNNSVYPQKLGSGILIEPWKIHEQDLSLAGH